MARRSTPSATPQPADLTVQQMQQAIPRLRKRIAEVEAFEPDAVDGRDPEAHITPLRASIQEALVRTFGNDTVEYYRYRNAADFSWPLSLYEPASTHEIRQSLERCKRASLMLLSQAVSVLEERIEEAGASLAPSAAPERFGSSPDSRKVFLVHGHDTAPREAAARLLEKTGFQPIILHEQANQGKTIIEKFEANADVGFAVVLLTPDDFGAAIGAEPHPRARQNVILELGYFIGRLGRERVCALKLGDVELPSDIFGVVWTDFDAAGAWKQALAKELSAAGYSVDWNKVMA